MRMSGVLRCAALPAAAIFAAACALKTPPDAAAIKKEGMPKVDVPSAWKGAPPAAGGVADNWLASFGDQDLNAAVAEAIANNADLRAGAARVETAQLYAKLAGARLYPSVDLLRSEERRVGKECR